MKKMKEIFDKIFVLTIKENADRHPSVKRILSDNTFEFWYGFNPKNEFKDAKYVRDIPIDFFNKNGIDFEYTTRFTMGQLGAYYSIKQMIDHIAENKYNLVLNFEDDMTPLKSNWEEILENAIAELPIGWDILLVGYNYNGRIYKLNYHRSLRIVYRIWNKITNLFRKNGAISPPVKFSQHLDYSGYSTGGHAYCISKKGAEILSAHLKPMCSSGDVLVGELLLTKKIKVFCVYPCLFEQNSNFDSKTIIN